MNGVHMRAEIEELMKGGSGNKRLPGGECLKGMNQWPNFELKTCSITIDVF